nr:MULTISPECIES: RHS repeat-associated core domain-containing protein [unclassified Streptococcus]
MTKDGVAVASSSYSLYGLTKQSTDETGNPFAYNGEARDITGLDYLRARYYDRRAGTFLTEDSYQGELGDPLSQNRYAYVHNNPVNYTDPSGHFWKSIKRAASNAWNGVKKAASKTWNTVKRVATNTWNSVKSAYNTAASWVGNKVNQAKQWVSQQWNNVTNWFGNQVNRVYQAGQQVYHSASSYTQAQHQQVQAQVQAQRQQAVQNEYAQATGMKGTPKSREGKNLLRNWGAALAKTLKHVCTTAKRVGKQIVKAAKKIDWKKVAVTAGAIGVGVALTIATGGLGAPIAMAIGGAASGAIISGYDAYSSGQRGWALAGAIGKGTGLGAITGFAGGSLMGAGSGIATSVTQNISNQAVRQVAKVGVEAGIETAIDTGLDVATGNQLTGQTVAMNFAYNLVSNGAGSVSPKKAPKADVNTAKPTTGEVLDADYIHQRPVRDITPAKSSSQKVLNDARTDTPRLEVSRVNVQAGTYKNQTKALKGTDYQAHHINQGAMMKKTVPNYSYNDGVTVPLIGNIRKDIGSPHYNAHASMEDFYNQYRKGGELEFEIPTVNDYNIATEKSLRNAGLQDSQINEIMSSVKVEQRYYGLDESSEIQLPGRLNLPRK